MKVNNWSVFTTDIENPKETHLVVIKNRTTKDNQGIMSGFQEKIGFAVVGNVPEDIVGTISERDICHALASEDGLGRATHISQVMTDNIVYCDLNDNLNTVRAIMTGHKSRHVLVKDAGNFVGIISIGDVVKHALDEALHDEEDLLNYIQGTGYNYAG
jgi:CBS domain-containing protein